MTLVVDNRDRLQGSRALHALIVGVSNYEHLREPGQPLKPEHYGLYKLSSPALSAFKLYRWLEEHQRKRGLVAEVGTIRLLLSPSKAEIDVEPALRDIAECCTLEHFLLAAKEWREDARTNANNVTLFYFAGHGLIREPAEAVMLMQEFGSGIGGPLRHAVEIANIVNGMAPTPTRDTIAQTQLYFIDACRTFPDALKVHHSPNTTDVFDVALPPRDDRSWPIFFASVPGTEALAVKRGATFFSTALLDCLNGAAADIKMDDEGEERWRISVHTLSSALPEKMRCLNEASELPADRWQTVVSGGQLKDAIIRNLDAPPAVEVVVKVIPSRANQTAVVEILDEQGQQTAILDHQGQQLPSLPVPLDPHPFTCTIPAPGRYTFQAWIRPPTEPWSDYPPRRRVVKPPCGVHEIRVGS